MTILYFVEDTYGNLLWDMEDPRWEHHPGADDGTCGEISDGTNDRNAAEQLALFLTMDFIRRGDSTRFKVVEYDYDDPQYLRYSEDTPVEKRPGALIGVRPSVAFQQSTQPN